MVFNASLMCVSIICEKGGKLLANKGAVGGSGLEESRLLSALTGHRYIFLMDGS